MALGGIDVQEASTIGPYLAFSGVGMLLSLGMACVLLDIMFNVRKIVESKNSDLPRWNRDEHRTEPEV